MKSALPKEPAQRSEASDSVIPLGHSASLKLARQPQERVIMWLVIPFLGCFDQQTLQWAKGGVDSWPTRTNLNPLTIAGRTQNKVTR